MAERLLVVLEPDNHPMDVLRRAAWLAGLYGADLTLLWCDPDVTPMGRPFLVSNEAREIGRKILEAQATIVEDLAEPLRAEGLNVDTDVLEERPVAEGILHRVEALDPAFVLKGTHYHPSAERSIFVDTDWHLMRACRKPLWLVKPGAIPENPRILAAVDPIHSHDKPAALDGAIVSHASDVAGRSGGEVELLHTYDLVAGIGSAATREFKPIKLAVDEIDEKMRREHRDKLDTLARRYGIDKAHTHQLAGAARELIPGYARQIGASLVVMGALARWGLKRAIIGSTAERVLDQLHCDILIVRKPGDD